MKEIQIVLVFETSRLKRTDDAYYLWMLKNYFFKEMSCGNNSGLRIIFHFAYMDGKTNYRNKRKQDSALKQINDYKRGYSGKTYVVYCFDVDTKTAADLSFYKEAALWCKESGFLVSMAFPEIEDVFGYGRDKGDKVCRMRLFARNYPKKNDIEKENLFVPLSSEPIALTSGQTTFCSVIKAIVDEAIF